MCSVWGVGETCWWIVHPSSRQRSEGEKVRVGDDLILVNMSSERYLVSQHSHGESASAASVTVNPQYFVLITDEMFGDATTLFCLSIYLLALDLTREA